MSPTVTKLSVIDLCALSTIFIIIIIIDWHNDVVSVCCRRVTVNYHSEYVDVVHL